MLADLVLLRPSALMLLLPVVGLGWLLLRRDAARHTWRGVIDAHLLPHLLVAPERRRGRLRPVVLLIAVLALGAVALSGPSFGRDDSGFADETAALVIAFEVTPSMLAEDVQPSRLARSAQKIGDLLDARPDLRASLVVYAGSAHVAMPLTRDPTIVARFAAEMAPDVLPVEGDDPIAAIALANEQLERAGVPGSVLLITDGVPVAAVDQLAAARAAGGARLQVWAVGEPAGAPARPGGPPVEPVDRDALGDLAAAGGGVMVVATADDRDVVALAARVASELDYVGAAGDAVRRRDDGYWLVLALLPLALLWFRRGFAVNHG